tara:strand:+ start:1429 stop:2004 length:576 start_codon:yes stop_codon:yes gene_type:complete
MTKFSSFKKQQTIFENWRRHTEELDESPRYDEGHADMDGEGGDNPSQDVYAMLDALRAELKGTSLEGAVLAIMDKMDANPEMTDTKYHPAGSDDDDIGYDVEEVPHLEESKSLEENLLGEDEMINLLRTISNKLDALEDIDTSIDYLASALSGEDALVMKAKQGMFGRLASADPANLKEELKEFFTKEKTK